MIASGGVRSGTDIAKALALKLKLSKSFTNLFFKQPSKAAKETEENLLSRLIEELRNVMFLVGAEKLDDLANTPVVITGKTAQWLQARGFNVGKYAERGAH